MRIPVVHAVKQFFHDDCLTMAAALAFYALFALPPFLFLLVSIVTIGMSAAYEDGVADDQARLMLEMQAENLIGNEAAAEEISKFMVRSAREQNVGWSADWKSIVSLVGLLIGATGLVNALQKSMNRVWGVRPAARSLARRFLLKRLFSLTMIIGFGGLVLTSFAVSTVLRTANEKISDFVGLDGTSPEFVNLVVSFATTAICFTLIFKFMPDAKVPWSHAFAGGLLAVILFTGGRTALFTFLERSNPAAQLGSAAASLAVILMWVFYSSISLLMGAEFTASLTPRELVEPEAGAEQAPEA